MNRILVGGTGPSAFLVLGFLVAGCSGSPTQGNRAPSVSIFTPIPSGIFDAGESIDFTGSATDPEDGALTGTSLAWTSDVDGAIGTGASFMRSDLSVGAHVLTLTATDSEGRSGSTTRPLTVNALPMVTIEEPLNDTEVDEGDVVSFFGTASDAEDGTLLSFSLVWTSSLDGQIGVGGGPFDIDDLSPGTHTITLAATDSDGGIGTDAVTLTVMDLPGDPPITIGNWILPLAYPGIPYGGSVQATGGTGTFAYLVTSGALPTGMLLGAASGVITGSSSVTGVHHFQVRVTSGTSTATRVYSITVSTTPSAAFNLQIANVADAIPSVSVQTALNQAVAKWEAVITGDLDGIITPPIGDSSCQGHGGKIPVGTAVDDLLILADIAPIDGPGSTLGQAGPCGFLTTDSPPFPTTGALRLDAVDLGGLSAVQQRALVFHEIGHIVGIGTLWTGNGRALLSGQDPTGADPLANPRFVGSAAIAAYDALGGPDADVPVEATGGTGTANSHWRETTFDHEVMTGFLEGPSVPTQPVSSMTIGSLADLGYAVNPGAAEAYTLPGGGGLQLEGGSSGEPGLPLGNDAVIEPLTLIAPDGSQRILEPLR